MQQVSLDRRDNIINITTAPPSVINKMYIKELSPAPMDMLVLVLDPKFDHKD